MKCRSTSFFAASPCPLPSQARDKNRLASFRQVFPPCKVRHADLRPDEEEKQTSQFLSDQVIADSRCRARGICLMAAAAHSAGLSTTTCETLAIERPEPVMKLSNRAPELKDSATENWPRYCHRLDALFKNTGMGICSRANCALTGLVRTPRPQSTTSGARGLNVLLRQAATILPLRVGRHDTTLPPRFA